MRSTWRAATGGVSLVTAAIALSACSSSPSATRSTTTTTQPTTSASSSTTTSATSTTTTSTSAATTDDVATCQVSGLRVAAVGQGGAAGTQEITFSLTNTSSTTPCATYGYPGMQLVSTAGANLPTTVDRGGGLDFESIAPAHLTLTPGQTTYFNVGFNDVQTATTTCSSTHTVEVTPPTNTAHATVDVGLGVYACDNGTLHVSAVFASTNSSATQTTAPSGA